MIADIAMAMYRQKLERLEKTKCPKNYCRIERIL